MNRLLLAGLAVVLLGAKDVRQNQDSNPPPPNPPPAGFNQFPPGQFQGGNLPGAVPFGQLQGQQFKDLVPPLIEALKDSDNEVRQTAASTLVMIGREAVPSLLEVLKDGAGETRANAAWVLGQMGQSAQEALPALVKKMKDEDLNVRRRAAFAVHRVVKDMREHGPGMGGMPGMPGMGGMGAGFGDRGHRSKAATVDVPDPGLILPGRAVKEKELPKDPPVNNKK